MIRSINKLFLSAVICSVALSGCGPNGTEQKNSKKTVSAKEQPSNQQQLNAGSPKNTPATTNANISTAVMESLQLAAAASDSPSAHDQILFQAAKKATTVDELALLAGKCRGGANRDAIVDIGLTKATTAGDSIKLARISGHRVHDPILLNGSRFAKSLDEIIALASNCNSPSNHDEILLSGVRLASNSSDLLKLANACIRGNQYRNAILTSKPGASKVETTTPQDTSDSSLQKAYQEMLSAQQAYLQTASGATSPDKVKALAEEYRLKKEAYEALTR